MTDPTPVPIPQENVNDESVQILAWRVEPGQRVEQGQALAELQGSKATFELYAPVAGVVRYTIAAGEEVAVGATLCLIEQDAPAAAPRDEAPAPAVAANSVAPVPAAAERADAAAPAAETAGGFRLSSQARQLVEQHGLDPAVFAGRGLVAAADVLQYLGKPVPAAEVRELIVQYLNDELPPAALAGGTFTVTDLSADGVSVFVPRLNQGQSAILGVGGEVFLPGSRWGTYQLLLAFDHQVTEGRLAAQFLNDLSRRLQGHEASLRQGRPADPAGAGPACSRCLRPLDELTELGAHLLPTVNPGQPESYVCTNCLLGF
jgi:pyruvate/2-oxoglutarate dehydrogenase complex dihydrolipoamide acyltransferase (E2) component